ncbi:ABC transporter ATP-binding protein [Helicobacter sp. 11S02596-1]|uniref:ABC transporter ATP-binding protein n=1 Tax=Helicobacter sp. 11S02596-1 TaxID=1476194 RepID=UPI000BA66BF1|nr:ABC transporter ATP-binding protein [Helicobacter sp. 11S02596-1]PAF44998.1 hypothetical protein BJI48_00010 [Helicobacter sp. 11S02596-1]
MKTQKPKTGISRLLEISGEKKYLLWLSGFFSAFHALLMLIPYIASFKILELFITHYHQYNNFQNIDKSLILHYGIIAIVAIVAGLICAYVGFLISHICAYDILFNTRLKLASHIGDLSLGFLGKTSIGKVKKSVQENVEKIENFIAHNIPDLIISTTTIIAILIMMFYLNIYLSLAFLLCVILAFSLQGILMMGKSGQKLVKQYYDSLEEINTQSIQYIKGMPTIKLFGKDIYAFAKFTKSIIDYRDFTLQITNKMLIPYGSFKIIIASTLSILMPLGIYMYARNPQNFDFILHLLFFVIITPAITSPMMRLIDSGSGIRDCNEGVERIDAILSQTPPLESNHPKTPQSFEVAFENVSFSYGNDEHYALKHINFTATQGITALVGPSGGGKSTILNLIARFYDVLDEPKNGKITIGGVNILDIPSKKLLEYVSFVFQDNFLFFDSVLENIRIAKPNATMAEIQHACKLASCDEFIAKLPRGYDTLIGQGGVRLSGGEEQRITLARALLKDTPILILDEASSFSDAHNEAQIQASLLEIAKNKVVFIIAHRLYLIKDAREILVFDQGELKAKGTHQELLTTSPLYEAMYSASLQVASYHLDNRLDNRLENKQAPQAQ